MNKHRNHQIDELAQRILGAALPSTWVPNRQEKDYAKDYFVEIGDDNGDLTGTSFYIQLKGQEKSKLSADGLQVKYSLKSKYAAYYFDKVKDLPVFLVLVDVNKKKGMVAVPPANSGSGSGMEKKKKHHRQYADGQRHIRCEKCAKGSGRCKRNGCGCNILSLFTRPFSLTRDGLSKVTRDST